MKHILLPLFLLCTGIGHAQKAIVWPGDINNNGIVNEVDVLSWGIAFGSTGPLRNKVDTLFVGWPVDTLWTDFFPDSTNYIYADANGDGIVNRTDFIDGIIPHFGLLHDSVLPEPSFPIDPDARIVPISLETSIPNLLSGGESFDFSIRLGNAVAPVEDFYGISFRLFYDPTLVDGGLDLELLADSWIKKSESDTAFAVFLRDDPELGEAYVAITRIDQQPIRGEGTILGGSVVMEDIIFEPINQDTLTIAIDSIRLIGPNLRSPQTIRKNLNVGLLVTNTKDLFNQDNLLQVFPNPTKNYINFNVLALDNNLVSLQLFNTFGNEIKHVTFSGPIQSYKMSVKDLTSGLFLAFIRTDQGLYSRKVFIH